MNTLPLPAQDGNPPEHRCTGPCGRTLPYTAEFFHRNGKYSLRPDCKECRSKKVKAYYHQPDVHEERLTYAREYRNQPGVQEQRSASNKEWKQRPEVKKYLHDYMQVYRIDYYSQPENRERRRAVDKVYNSLPSTREHRRPKERVYSAKRRAIKRAIQGNHTSEQIQEQLKKQRYRCYYAACGHAKFEKRNGKYIYHIDHTFPLVRVVGTDIPANDMSYLVLACPHCNASKSDKFPWEWPEGGRLL